MTKEHEDLKRFLAWFKGNYLGKKFLYMLATGFEVTLHTKNKTKNNNNKKQEYKSLSGLLGLADSIN